MDGQAPRMGTKPQEISTLWTQSSDQIRSVPTKPPTIGTRPSRMNAGKKQRPSGAAARMPTRRAADSTATRRSALISRARSKRRPASGAPLSAERLKAAPRGPRRSSVPKVSQLPTGSPPSSSAATTRRSSSARGPVIASATAARASRGGAPDAMHAASSSVASGKVCDIRRRRSVAAALAERRSARSTIPPPAIPQNAPTKPPMATAMSVPMATAATAGNLGRGRVAVPGPVRVPRTTTDGRNAATGASTDVTNRNRRAAPARGAIQASTARPAQIAVNSAKRDPPPHGA